MSKRRSEHQKPNSVIRSNSVSSSSSVTLSENKQALWQPGCPDIFVHRWCDYSQKYGLAYLLSNGLVGVSFNDGSRMLAHPESPEFLYSTKVLFNDGRWRSSTKQFQFAAFPEELKVRITLWTKFRDYLLAGDFNHKFTSKLEP